MKYKMFPKECIRHNIISFLKIKQNITYNFIPLIYMVSARKQYASANHFPHDTADWPNIHIFFVTHTKYHLKNVKIRVWGKMKTDGNFEHDSKFNEKKLLKWFSFSYVNTDKNCR